MSKTQSEKAEAFGKKMTDILNYGALNLAVAIGYRLQLFEVMAALDRPVTIGKLAEKSGKNPRYIKEWLGVMVTGQVVELSHQSDGTALYYLPPEHAAFLIRSADGGNMGVYTQEMPLLTQCAMEAVVSGFDTGKGVPFSSYPRFQAFMAELSNNRHRQVLVENFLPGVDGGRLVKCLESGISVCDLGCGEGVALNLMAKAFPRSRFTGIDNHEPALESAQKEAKAMGLDNVTYCLEDAACLSGDPRFDGKFDYICAFDAIHDQSHPLAALKGVRSMLAPAGMFSMVDIDADSRHAGNMEHAMGPFLYAVSLMHCMPVGLNDNGTGLGMMWGRQKARQLLTAAGFDEVVEENMPHDPFNVHFLCRVYATGSA